ncbi:hypothetical protein KPL74_13625 [Bacillus sp. NP157]|nr:hypothetical protein KPL74_13625 [Bacillus sp. NP157]
MDTKAIDMTLWGERPGEPPFPIRLVIGVPVVPPDDHGLWECAVELSPLFQRLRGARSDDPLHSLCLTLSLVLDLLTDFQQKGNRLSETSGGPELSFEHYAFGPAQRR